MLRKVRSILAVFFFMCVTVLFLDFTGTAHTYLSWIAKIQFIPAVLSLNAIVVISLLLLTFIFGRLYCSVICPMGIFQDIISWVAGKTKRNRFTYSPAKNILRYVILAIYAVTVILGIGIVIAILDPYAAYGRIVNTILQPLYELCNNGLAIIAERMNSYAFYKVDVWVRSISALATAITTLIVIAILAWRNGRTYCNTICPIGTLLGFVSKYSLLKPAIDTTKCNGCTLCQRNCKASCINAKEHKIDYSRCVTCGDCIEKCNRGAITYSFRKSEKPAEARQDNVDTSKRAFMATAAAMATASTIKAQDKVLDGGLAVILDKEIPERQTRIVPAGSLSLNNFLSKCVGCQLCVSACPNNVLRPNMLQPEMSYENGYCRPECTKCSEVCPSGAITLINKTEKSSIQIGHAVWRKKNCVVFTDNVECGNCARHCPSGAISMVHTDKDDPKSPTFPVVNPERCIGCGACDNLCPARPFTAIYVEGHEVHKFI